MTMDKRNNRPFPSDFLWGCGLTPTVVEGAALNEWKNLIARDESTAEAGPNHLQRFEYDYSCLQEMGCNACRLGFDWGRLQPEPYAHLDRNASLLYLEMLADLRARRIEPVLSLFDLALPHWFSSDQGWLNRQAPEIFADFVSRVVDLVDGEVNYFLTMIQPHHYAVLSQIMEELPPFGRRQHAKMGKTVKQLAMAHGAAYRAIKERHPVAKVGFTRYGMELPAEPEEGLLSRLAAAGASMLFDTEELCPFLMDGKEAVCDFVGLDYYSHLTAHLSTKGETESHELRMLEGLTRLAEESKLPLMVTGCGLPFTEEVHRTAFLAGMIGVCRRALEQGIDLRGYIHWSLLDGFEWKEGLEPRFGLVGVDHQHPKRFRKMRSSGSAYRQLISETRIVTPS